MMVKLSFLAISLCFFMLISCQKSSKSTVGFLLPNLTDGRYPKDRDFFIAKINSLGGKAEVDDAKNDPQLQETQARQMIDKGIKVIVICAVNQNLAASIIRLAHEHGTVVIGYERLIQNCSLDYFVGFDHYVVGKQQASFAVQKNPHGNFVLIEGDKNDKNAELIYKGHMEILQPLMKSGQIKLLYQSFIEDWSADGAKDEVRRVSNLSGEKLDVVLSANDGMAGGVSVALESLQPGYPVIITGLDADILGCNRVVDGRQSMTVYKPLKIQAEITAELVMNLLNHKSITNMTGTISNGFTNVPSIMLQAVVVDQNNMKSTIISDGFLKESDVYSTRHN